MMKNLEGQGNEKYSTFPEGALESFYSTSNKLLAMC